MSALLDNNSGNRCAVAVPALNASSLFWCAMALVASAVGLVSCADQSAMPPHPPAPVAVAAVPAAVVPPPSVAPAPVPRRKPAPSARTSAAVAATAPFAATPERSAERSIDPARLVGLTEQETLRLLGAPSRKADAPPAKYWQYASRRCVLRVFFFMEMDSRDFRTLSYELKSVNNDPTVDQQCLADFVAQADRH
jgi:hypothetical protein